MTPADLLPNPAVKQTYSPKEIALAVGVSESSLKRWADKGKLEFVKTVGGHRRITFHEAIRFAREAQLPILRPDVLGLPDLKPSDSFADGSPEQVLYTLLSEGRSPEARVMLMDLYLKGSSLASLADGPIMEAMRRIGELWRDDDSKGVYVEHRATDAMIQAVTSLRALATPQLSPEEDDRPIAIGGAPAQDTHQLASIMIAAVVAETGFRDMNLGPDTPMDALLEAIRTHKPKLVWLSSSMAQTRPSDAELRRLTDEVSLLGGFLVLGGAGFYEKAPPPSPRIKTCATLSELAALASGMLIGNESPAR